MNLTLYHAPLTRSARILWLLEEMALPYELKVVPQAEFRTYGQSADYKKISPMGKWPVLLDDGEPILESTAIMEYLLDRYGDQCTGKALHPPHKTIEYGRYLQWLHFGEAGLTTAITMLLGHTVFLPEKLRDPKMVVWAKAESTKNMQFIADALGDKEYMLGTFSAADISIGYMLFLHRVINQFDIVPDNLKAYWQRLKQRPAWQKVASISGPEDV